MNDASEIAPDSGIELRSWRQFLTLAHTLHFGRAAQLLHMTQPPLTLAIQQLERRLGARLFERTRRSVALTPVGAALIDPVHHLLQQASVLRTRANEALTGEVGRVRVGFISTVGFGPLPIWLRSFREQCPGVAIELIEATSDVQLRAFEREEIDVGFMLHAPGLAPELPARLQLLSLGIEPLVLALPDENAWTATRRLRAADVLSQPLVIFPRSATPSLYDAVLAFYHAHGSTPVIAQEATQMQTIVNLVSAGLGVALVPSAVTQLQRPGVVYRRLPAALSAAAPHCETSLLWSSESAPAVQKFVQFVRGLLPKWSSKPLRYRSS
jgi:DNA-binding transcriptional LysR family regulator